MTNDTQNFIEALLFGYYWEYSKYDEGDVTIYDIHASDVERIEDFIDSFRDHLESSHPELVERLDCLERSFGGNCYWSLSGHGIGFFDDADCDLAGLQGILEQFAGNAYQFEEVELVKDGDKYRLEWAQW